MSEKKAKGGKVDESHLVPVTKDGETLYVHPDTVAAHIRAGWVLEG